MSAAKRGREARREAREAEYRETYDRYKSLKDAEDGASETTDADVPEEKRTPDPADLGWRSSRRSSRLGREARRVKKREERVQATRETATDVAVAGGKALWSTTRVVVVIGGTVLASILILFLAASAINWIARWDAQRRAADEPTIAELAQDNLLVIGVEGTEVGGFLAMRVEEGEDQVFGVAIPDAAFMEVPGQGFERVGDSYKDGPEVSAAAISNFLSVPFDQWVIVEAAAYQAAMQEQSLAGLLDTVLETNMSTGDVGRFATAFDQVPEDAVALVPLPVKPISLGDETYFEPQREEVADLLSSWWGVSMGSDKDTIRVIVYNGSGEPGIAGKAAQELISQGYRVVETRNADNFDYETSLVILYHGEEVDARAVRDALGVGEIVFEDASQQVADIIVIIGSDYAPPAEGE